MASRLKQSAYLGTPPLATQAESRRRCSRYINPTTTAKHRTEKANMAMIGQSLLADAPDLDTLIEVVDEC